MKAKRETVKDEDPLDFVTYNPNTGKYTMSPGASADLGHKALTVALRRENLGNPNEPLPTKEENGSLILSRTEADAVVGGLAFIASARRPDSDVAMPNLEFIDMLSTAFERASAAALLWPSHEAQTTIEQLQMMIEARANIEQLAASIGNCDPITV